jgi:HK97 family phage portal protein
MKLFDRLFKPREPPRANNLLGGGLFFGYGGSMAGKTVDEYSALQTSAVYACVRIIAEGIAGLPLHVYRNTEQGKERAYEHKLYYLLHDAPNSEITSFQWRETMLVHLLLSGNSYSQIIRNGKGEVIALQQLMPNRMTVERINGKLMYTYLDDEGRQVKLPKEQVLHIAGMGYDGIIGYSPLALAKNSIGLGIALEEFSSKYFANGSILGGVLESPHIIKDIERLRSSWENQYSGSNNAHRTAVLEEGIQYKSLGNTPEASQMIESRRFQIEEICRIYRVPPHMLADLERASFSNIESQTLSFVKYSLAPWVQRIEAAMSQSLISVSERGKISINFNIDGLLRASYKERMEGYAIGLERGIYSVNEIRDLENLNQLPDETGGNLHLCNGASVKLSDAGIYANRRIIRESEVNESET